MATPTRPAVRNTISPSTEISQPQDGVISLDVHIRLAGTPAAVNADFATLAAVNFTAATAILTWDRT